MNNNRPQNVGTHLNRSEVKKQIAVFADSF